MFAQEQVATIARAFSLYDLVGQAAAFAAAVNLDDRLFRVAADVAGVTALRSIPKPLFPPISFPEYRLR